MVGGPDSYREIDATDTKCPGGGPDSYREVDATDIKCPGGGIGRRAGFKIQFWQQSAGSIPAPGTTKA